MIMSSSTDPTRNTTGGSNPPSSAVAARNNRNIYFPDSSTRASVRTSLNATEEGGGFTPQQHSPLVQGLLRYSPKASWSPRPPNSSSAPNSRSFFGGKTETARPQDTPDTEERTIPPAESTLEASTFPHLRSRAPYSPLFASLLHAQTQDPADALILAQTLFEDSNARTCLTVLEQAGLLQLPSSSPLRWKALILAAKAVAQCEAWPSLVELLQDAFRIPHHFPNDESEEPLLHDDDELGWHALQEGIDRACGSGAESGELHLLAQLLWWRGQAHFKSAGHGNNKARRYWERALRVDAHCHLAWEALLERHLLTLHEAYGLLQQLEFPQSGQYWCKSLYLASLSVGVAVTGTTKSSTSEATLPEGPDLAAGTNTPFVDLDASAIPFASPVPTPRYRHEFSASIVSTPTPAATAKKQQQLHAGSTILSQQQQQHHHKMQQDVNAAFHHLWDESKLSSAPYLLSLAARRAFDRFQWSRCVQYCEQLAITDPDLSGAADCYLSSLVTLNRPRALFSIAHTWVEARPQSAWSWLAVGCYYYCTGRYHVAQRHFCRATRLDPDHHAAWLAFGCAFGAVEESDQALASFRAAHRLSPGDATALLYLGMECLRTNHLVVAKHFLEAALSSSGNSLQEGSSTVAGGGSSVDPLVWHELGIWYWHNGDVDQAVHWLERTVEVVKNQAHGSITYANDNVGTNHLVAEEASVDATTAFWEPTFFALGHCYRRLRQYEKARECYEYCLSLQPNESSNYAAVGFCHHLCRDWSAALASYHAALALKPNDAWTTELLQRALRESVEANDSSKENSQTPVIPIDSRVKQLHQQALDLSELVMAESMHNVGHNDLSQSMDQVHTPGAM